MDLTRNDGGALTNDALAEFLACDDPIDTPADATELVCLLASYVNHHPNGMTDWPATPEDCFCPHRPIVDRFLNQGEALRFIVRATLVMLGEDPDAPTTDPDKRTSVLADDEEETDDGD